MLSYLRLQWGERVGFGARAGLDVRAQRVGHRGEGYLHDGVIGNAEQVGHFPLATEVTRGPGGAESTFPLPDRWTLDGLR
ncbi:hypothetical protein [Micromonospora sp. NPDC049301]|uniref:hypothetical protein n=1 Tax=Micromonospora sp. NPDC049301 TaxID=3155723 RepID=UPI00341E8AC4